MILSDTAIKRPVFMTMVIGAIVVFGVISYLDLGIDLFPKVDIPLLTIVSVLPGADPESVESTVTDPIEESVSSISGLKDLRSTSTDGVSQVMMEFELEKNIDIAFQEVQARLGTIRSTLPKDMEDPVVEKVDLDAAPVLGVIVSGELPLKDLTWIAKRRVKERLQQIPFVGQVTMSGGRDRKIWVWLDRDKLEGHGLTVQDVEMAIRAKHISIPGGRVESGTRELIVKTKAEYESAAELENLELANLNGAVVRLSDVGRVEDGLEEERTLARLDDRRAVALIVRRQSGGNTVAVARALKAAVEKLAKDLAPQGVRLEIASDMSLYIERAVGEVRFHLLFGGALAVFIVFFFLRNQRSTFISALVLPTSVIGAFMLMALLGFTQNMMTLLALSLSIGLLIDDAIVVQENILRHVEGGMPARESATRATSEIALAVLATTLSVVAVFVPVAFMKGMVGRFFNQFGLTVAFAVMLSMFVSFTLDPMLSSRILRKPRRGGLYRLSELFFAAVDNGYEWLLGWSLRHRPAVLLIALVSFGGAGYAAKRLRFEFMPQEDQSQFNVRVTAPQGTSLAGTDAIAGKVRADLKGLPWLEYTMTTIGADALNKVNEGLIYVKMKDKGLRKISQQDAVNWVREKVRGLRDVKVSVEPFQPVSIGGGTRQAEIMVDIRGRDLDRLQEVTAGFLERMRKSTGYVDVDTTYESGKPQVGVYVKRDRASDLGVSPLEIASTVRSLIGGNDVSKFQSEGERYDIAVRLQEPFRGRPEDIDRLSLRSRRGELVSLANVAYVKNEGGPVQINRYGRSRQISILANLDTKVKVLGEASKELEGFVAGTVLPPGTRIELVGWTERMKENFRNLFFALALAVVFVYMVLAAQFESFLHPFTIMLSLPLSVVGALGALIAFHMTMHIFTMIGIIMLMGLVTKNAILLVDYTNTLRRRDGMERDAAIRKAGPTRLRPILMTTLAMIFGMLPTALGTGSGSESRAPMAVAVIGGLITSTLLTLVVVPVVYTLLDGVQARILGRRRPPAG